MSRSVRLGYKQTELGVIPKDWMIAKLGNHVEFRTGPFGSALHKSDYVADGVPVINPMQIIDGGLQPTRSMAITEQAARKLKNFRLSVGNIVIGRRGDMGRCAFVRKEHEGWLCGTGSMIIRVMPAIDADFLQRILSSPPVISAIENTSVGSTMANLNQGTLGNLVIPLPSTKAEQESIAVALRDADGLIDALQQFLTKKRYLKQGAMQELLTGRTRLPGFGAEWRIVRLDEIGTWKGGMTPSMQNSSYWHMGTVPWISSGDVKSVLLTTTAVAITDAAITQGTTILVPANSIIVVTRSGILRKYLPVAMNMIPMAINQDIKALIPNGQVISSYLLHTLIGHGDEILARCMKAGTTVESIEFPWMKAFTVPLPPLSEQAAIAAVLSDMDAEIADLESKLTKARAIKQGMMSELLTGKIRLI